MQIEMCKKYVEFHGGEVCKTVYDELISGGTDNRPGLQQILKELKSGTAEWHHIIVYKLDRLFRSLKHSINFFELLHEKGKGIVSLSERIDFSNPMSKAAMYIFCVMAQLQREESAVRIREKMIFMAQQGKYCPGKAPYGYRRSSEADKKNVLVPEPRKAEIVKDLFQSYATGVSVDNLSRKYQIAPSTIGSLLRNRHYLGKIIYSGEEYEGQHDAIITEDVFDKVQKILPKNLKATRRNAQKYDYLLLGLLKCNCGNRALTCYSTCGRNGKYFYYFCTDQIECRYRIPASKLENAVLELVRKVPLQKKEIQYLLEKAKQDNIEIVKTRAPELKQVEKAYREALRERKKMETMFVNGIVTKENKDHWNKQLYKLNQEIEMLVVKRDSLKLELESRDLDLNIEAIIDQLKSFADCLDKAGEDKELVRSFLKSRVRKIKRLEGSRFEVELLVDKKGRFGPNIEMEVA